MALIEAAERIVAERGIAALTVKDVQVAARQSNRSAVRYHFGSRNDLLEAVLDLRMRPVDNKRQEMLDRIGRSGDPPQARQAVEALVHPLAAETLGRADSRYARFLVQTLFDPVLAEIAQKHLRAESFRMVHKLLIGLCPAGEPAASWRADNIAQLNMITLATQEGRGTRRPESAAVVEDLITSCTALLTAPAPKAGD
ncbi:TetR/AcrR family transcriptional regulator (plasmid) [Tomitella fengzijianii]|uniref:TetR/AcrR family transcriptional regulator n=1 Tax=Tomitella fengzijianii TaxID=2597660 RepID=A0A516X8Z3_9ACTN|nr:TetR/AcrR family transcriptional regulator [Tomitella fengzijianii]